MLYVLAALVYGADLLVKWIVQTHMFVGEAISVIPSILYIDYTLNPGAAWGIFAYHRWLLMVVPIAVSLGVVYFSIKQRHGPRWTTIASALVLGGALGNLTDRVVRGEVVDYIYFKVINYPVFNLADSAVVVGIIMLVWHSMRSNGRNVQSGSEEVNK